MDQDRHNDCVEDNNTHSLLLNTVKRSFTRTRLVPDFGPYISTLLLSDSCKSDSYECS